MSVGPPTFCKDTRKDYSFSEKCETISKFKPKKRSSLFEIKETENIKKTDNNNIKKKTNKHKHKHTHSHIHSHKHKKRHHSELGKIQISKFHQDIKNIMKKNKFILRNDFDNRNVEEFLLSKEKAFEIPFILISDTE